MPTPAPVRVGLVGAGPWARNVHAPMYAAGPETGLTAVWARRPEAATELAGRYAARAVTDFADLLPLCDVVAFAVPPDVQADLAVTAARAGRHLALDKPLALTLDAARRVAEAVDAAGVHSQILLSNRYRAATRRFLDDA